MADNLAPLWNRALNNLDRVFIETDKRQWSYGESLYLISKLILNNKERGIKAGDRVAILLPENAGFLFLFLSFITSGVTVIPLSGQTPPDKLLKWLMEIDCHFLITNREDIGSSKRKIKILSWDFEFENLHHGSDSFPIHLFQQVDLEQESTILFTSGTTGSAKAVLHSIKSHLVSAEASNKTVPFEAGDKWLLSLSLSHIAGVAISFRAISVGGTIVILPKPERGDWTADILRHQVTHVSFVPTQLQRLMNSDETAPLPSLKTILLGGATISRSLVYKARSRGLPVRCTYGSTELASQIATSDLNQIDTLQALPSVDFKISNQGELLVKGETLCKGYLNQPDLFSQRIDEDGWFRTGDRVYPIKNKSGGFRVLGRIDRMFISGGENIYPEEIETLLLSHKGIEKAVVLAIKNEEFGERPVAFLKLSKEHPFLPSVFEQYLSTKIPGFKVPDYFLPWPRKEPSQGLRSQDNSLKPNLKYFQRLLDFLFHSEKRREND